MEGRGRSCPVWPCRGWLQFPGQEAGPVSKGCRWRALTFCPPQVVPCAVVGTQCPFAQERPRCLGGPVALSDTVNRAGALEQEHWAFEAASAAPHRLCPWPLAWGSRVAPGRGAVGDVWQAGSGAGRTLGGVRVAPLLGALWCTRVCRLSHEQGMLLTMVLTGFGRVGEAVGTWGGEQT